MNEKMYGVVEEMSFWKLSNILDFSDENRIIPTLYSWGNIDYTFRNKDSTLTIYKDFRILLLAYQRQKNLGWNISTESQSI